MNHRCLQEKYQLDDEECYQPKPRALCQDCNGMNGQHQALCPNAPGSGRLYRPAEVVRHPPITERHEVAETEEEMLPGNVWQGKDGKLYADCRVCGRKCEIDPEFIEGMTPDEDYHHLCGSRPACCP